MAPTPQAASPRLGAPGRVGDGRSGANCVVDRFTARRTARWRPGRPRSGRPPSRPSLRSGEAGPDDPAPDRPSPPAAPSEFDDDLPPPPRACHISPPERPGRRAETNRYGAGGLTAVVWFLRVGSWSARFVHLSLHVRVDPSPRSASHRLYCTTGFMMLVAMILHLWGFFWLLSFAFREDLMRGLFCLFVPFYVVHLRGESMAGATRDRGPDACVSARRALRHRPGLNGLAGAEGATISSRPTLGGGWAENAPQGNSVQPNPAPGCR